jgi:hypothetical protein
MDDILGWGRIADAAARIYVKTVEVALELVKPRKLTDEEARRVTDAKRVVVQALQQRVQTIPRPREWLGGTYDLRMGDLDSLIAANRGAILQVPGGKGALKACDRATKAARELKGKLRAWELRQQAPGPKVEGKGYPRMAARRSRRSFQTAADRVASLKRYTASSN